MFALKNKDKLHFKGAKQLAHKETDKQNDVQTENSELIRPSMIKKNVNLILEDGF